MEKEEKSVSRSWYKIMLIALKVIPMLLALCSMLNMIFDFFGIDSFVLSFIGGISVLPLLFLYVVAYVFRFCVYHRMFLHYIVANNLLTYTDYYIGIPVSNEILFMVHMFLVGVALFFILYFYRRERCCRQ